jgi:hypothetical protein
MKFLRSVEDKRRIRIRIKNENFKEVAIQNLFIVRQKRNGCSGLATWKELVEYRRAFDLKFKGKRCV